MFLVGNWAPELQTDVKGGGKVEVVRRRGRPKDERETVDKDMSICDRLVFVSESLCCVWQTLRACLHVCARKSETPLRESACVCLNERGRLRDCFSLKFDEVVAEQK